MLDGPRRFHDLQASLSRINPNTLSARLKALEVHGIIERRFYADHPPRAEYVLTAKGNGFCQLSCPGIGTGVSAVLPFRLPPGFRALSPCDACGEGAASLPEHVGTCGTGSGESLGVRRALGNIVLLMRCS
jgi:hypothetical protein